MHNSSQSIGHGYLQTTSAIINPEPAWSGSGQGEASWNLSEICYVREKNKYREIFFAIFGNNHFSVFASPPKHEEWTSRIPHLPKGNTAWGFTLKQTNIQQSSIAKGFYKFPIMYFIEEYDIGHDHEIVTSQRRQQSLTSGRCGVDVSSNVFHWRDWICQFISYLEKMM